MSSGIPLTDEDRWQWLERLHVELRSMAGKGAPIFLACSALKQAYRDRLIAGLSQVRFVYLKGSMELIRRRMLARPHHFMPAALLESQFADLEEPADAIVLDIARSPEEMVHDFLRIAG